MKGSIYVRPQTEISDSLESDSDGPLQSPKSRDVAANLSPGVSLVESEGKNEFRKGESEV